MVDTKQTLARLRDQVNAEWDEWAAESKETADLKTVAVCLSKGDRGDPYLLCMGHANNVICMAPKGTVTVCYPLQPVWVLYIDEARTAIDAVKQLG